MIVDLQGGAVRFLAGGSPAELRALGGLPELAEVPPAEVWRHWALEEERTLAWGRLRSIPDATCGDAWVLGLRTGPGPAGLFGNDHLTDIVARVEETFGPRPLRWEPLTQLQWERARLAPADGVTREVGPPPRRADALDTYVPGVAYGRLRTVPPDQLEELDASGQLSPRDLLLTRSAPAELATPVGALLTVGRQGPLSHVNLLLAGRGAPSAYAPGAWSGLAARDGELVGMDVSPAGVVTWPATEEEAATWWDRTRPGGPGWGRPRR